ncbi:MAG: CoA activase, partial [Armatimonadetes bacterium]|nr:CoA activase [Armatimonadota bacterium]
MSSQDLYLGIDVGSVSVNLAVIDAQDNIIEEQYIRHHAHPMQRAAQALQQAVDSYGRERIAGLAATGNGGRTVARILGADFVNEVVAQATATRRLFPQVNTVIEIGGEDSKLIFIEDSQQDGSGEVADFAMNAACAAGTGSFLDQQASRLGLDIEEFGQLALQSEHPPRVAGRCSVFAKTDMIHLQQKATPEHDIVAGLCFALARNFKSTVGSGADITPPLSFHGGLAANPGMVRAIKEVFEADGDQLIIPEHFATMGAIGAVLKARQSGIQMPDLDKLEELRRYQVQVGEEKDLEPLSIEKSTIQPSRLVAPTVEPGQKIPAYLGVDVGSISTCLAVIDTDANVLAKEYLMTAGRPLVAVQEGLRRIGEKYGDILDIQGAATTGSGRYFIGDVIGADIIKNEITAHARGALQIAPDVDTIFEIGGQDSKYTSLQGGAVVDFAMNNVCAAGTGSFLEEQAERLAISIEDEFAELAFKSQAPANLGERCTVFMETQVTRHQQSGAIK